MVSMCTVQLYTHLLCNYTVTVWINSQFTVRLKIYYCFFQKNKEDSGSMKDDTGNPHLHQGLEKPTFNTAVAN